MSGFRQCVYDPKQVCNLLSQNITFCLTNKYYKYEISYFSRDYPIIGSLVLNHRVKEPIVVHLCPLLAQYTVTSNIPNTYLRSFSDAKTLSDWLARLKETTTLYVVMQMVFGISET